MMHDQDDQRVRKNELNMMEGIILRPIEFQNLYLEIIIREGRKESTYRNWYDQTTIGYARMNYYDGGILLPSLSWNSFLARMSLSVYCFPSTSQIIIIRAGSKAKTLLYKST
jgi:hypothetical protein